MVWRAEGPAGPVALKVAQSESQQVALRHEAAILDWVDHPNVIRKVQAHPSGTWLALEYVEGAVANVEHAEVLHLIRERSGLVVAFGDCAVSGNITALRNTFTCDEVLNRSYRQPGAVINGVPLGDDVLPALLPKVVPLHTLVKVDHWLQGCPPDADKIWELVTALLDGRAPKLERRFG